MTNMNNIIIEATATEIKFPTNGNCKKVKDITANKEYGSITEAAICHGVTLGAMSNAIRNKAMCKGHMFVLLKELHENTELLCEENAKANRRADKARAKADKEAARADKAEAKLTAMESELAEFRKWKAEQEAKRKAEEARLKAERKAKEAEERKIRQAEYRVHELSARFEKEREKAKRTGDMLMQAEKELEALLDARKEVK